MNMNGVYVADLDRFGYTLRAVGRNKAEAKTAISEAFIRAYSDYNNGLNIVKMRAALEEPSPKSGDDDIFANLYDEFVDKDRVAMEDCYVRFCEFGKVEWE